MKEIYEAAAEATYKNCLELLDETNILYLHSKFSRAYALCILSVEEFSKSYHYKCLSVGVNSNMRTNNHEEKISRAIRLLLSMYTFSKYVVEILRAVQEPLAETVIKESIIQRMKSELDVGLLRGRYRQ
jgi:AbiV family abortive infection protein